jgi:hypothetical protein
LKKLQKKLVNHDSRVAHGLVLGSVLVMFLVIFHCFSDFWRF